MADTRKVLEKAAAFVAKGKLEKALEAYQEAITLDPLDPLPLQRRAEILLRMGAEDDAIGSYLAATRLYTNVEDAPKAMALFKAVLRLRPENANARAGLDAAERRGKAIMSDRRDVTPVPRARAIAMPDSARDASTHIVRDFREQDSSPPAPVRNVGPPAGPVRTVGPIAAPVRTVAPPAAPAPAPRPPAPAAAPASAPRPPAPAAARGGFEIEGHDEEPEDVELMEPPRGVPPARPAPPSSPPPQQRLSSFNAPGGGPAGATPPPARRPPTAPPPPPRPTPAAPVTPPAAEQPPAMLDFSPRRQPVIREYVAGGPNAPRAPVAPGARPGTPPPLAAPRPPVPVAARLAAARPASPASPAAPASPAPIESRARRPALSAMFNPGGGPSGDDNADAIARAIDHAIESGAGLDPLPSADTSPTEVELPANPTPLPVRLRPPAGPPESALPVVSRPPPAPAPPAKPRRTTTHEEGILELESEIAFAEQIISESGLHGAVGSEQIGGVDPLAGLSVDDDDAAPGPGPGPRRHDPGRDDPF